jgi:hypothetical protein
MHQGEHAARDQHDNAKNRGEDSEEFARAAAFALAFVDA